MSQSYLFARKLAVPAGGASPGDTLRWDTGAGAAQYCGVGFDTVVDQGQLQAVVVGSGTFQIMAHLGTVPVRLRVLPAGFGDPTGSYVCAASHAVLSSTPSAPTFPSLAPVAHASCLQTVGGGPSAAVLVEYAGQEPISEAELQHWADAVSEGTTLFAVRQVA